MRPDESSPLTPTFLDWKSALRADMRLAGARRPWGRALRAIGWIHLVFFLACQVAFTWADKSKVLILSLWAIELFAVILTMRRVAGRDWYRDSPGVALVVRIWVTFLILSFNVTSLNSLTGWTLDWFKPVWCTLGSFGFATLAWLFGLRYLIWAVQMYFTGLIMVRFPDANYVIYALSWLLIFQVIGRDLDRRRARWIIEGVSLLERDEPPSEPLSVPPVPVEMMDAWDASGAGGIIES